MDTLLNLPDVGQNLQDQPLIAFPWMVTSNDTFDTFTENTTAFAAAKAQYVADRTGVIANSAVGNQLAFLRLPSSSSLLTEFGDPSAGPTAPHFELAFTVSALQA